ncbi:6dde2068-41d6-464d-8dad-072732efd642 [Sclerotinia trifoliorum]|uniref:6dde2068-41d6-464d-8dad-072732efd642 n=1 Tax=Sclerotinia trifoliorum TaxID=28548 RepID=A0A8H2ZUJ0_9HELO|nr:6dde2068-41d6-464d-8dad-072732efd642 [Sclerotinia trifoliorum]
MEDSKLICIGTVFILFSHTHKDHPAQRHPHRNIEKNELVLGQEEDLDPDSFLPKEDCVAWLQVLGAFCLNLNTWGLMNAYGAFLLFLTSVSAGPIFDAGYYKVLLWAGSILTVLGMFMTSICNEYYQFFLAQGIMMGLGFGLLYLPAPAIVSQFFHVRRAIAVGISSTGSALGGVIYPIVFTKLQPHIGFGWATRVIAFIILATSLPPLFCMKSLSVPKPWRTVLGPTVFRDIPYILLNSSSSPVQANYLLVTIKGSSLFNRTILGFYADKIGSINVQTIVAITSAILTFCLIAIRSSAGLVIYTLLYGFSAGAFMAPPTAGVAGLSDDHSKVSIRLGMTLEFVRSGVLVSTSIAGAILSRDNGSWVGLTVWCGVLPTADAVSMMASRTARVGVKLIEAI